MVIYLVVVLPVPIVNIELTEDIAAAVRTWLENIKPAERALELMPYLVVYCTAAKSKKVTEPNNKSFQATMKAIQDPLIMPKLQFFLFIAREVQPFLAKYQTDRPMLPFISSDLHELLLSMMQICIKPDDLDQEGSTLAGLVKISLGRENQVPLEKVNIGYLAKKELVKTSISDKQRLEFRSECRNFVVAMLKKLLDKSPATYPLVRNLSCLDPRMMAQKEKKEVMEKNMNRILGLMSNAHRVKDEACDSVLSQYGQLLKSASSDLQSEMGNFDQEKDRLDVFFFNVVGGNSKLKDLWSVMRQLLLLSHGQATVERGFSVNKEASTDNLSERAMVAKRQIINHVRQVGGIEYVEVSAKLLTAASSARSQYHNYLEEERKKEAEAASAAKRKHIESEVGELITKKKKLEKDIEELSRKSDDLAKKGADQHSWCLINLSIGAKDRVHDLRAELSTLCNEIAEKEQLLK